MLQFRISSVQSSTIGQIRQSSSQTTLPSAAVGVLAVPACETAQFCNGWIFTRTYVCVENVTFCGGISFDLLCGG